MRTFESLLLLADLMAFLALSVPGRRGGLWMRHWPVIASVMAAAQWLAEGPRWQMLPAYALTVSFLLVRLHRNFASRGRPPEQKPRHPMVAAGIVNAYSLAFFDRHLMGRQAKLLEGAAKQYPEVLFESRRP